MKSVSICSLIFVCFLMGCKDPEGKTAGGKYDREEAAKQTAKALFGDPNDKRMRLETYSRTVEGDEYGTPVTNSTYEPTPEQLRAAFEDLEWANEKIDCFISLSRSTIVQDDFVGMTISGTRSARKDKPFEARWTERPDGAPWQRLNAELSRQPDMALELLLSFLAEDDRYRDMVDWKD